MNKKAIKPFLESEEGKRNAERFLKALKEGRIIVSIPHVSNTGMSRIIRFREVVNLRDANPPRYAIYQFDWFLERIGYSYSRNWDGIRISGCGMDMVFNTLYNVCDELKVNGFDVPEDFSLLAESYLKV